MNKKITLFLLLFLIVLVIALIFYIKISVPMKNVVINVNTGLRYNTVEGAINAPETKDGDKILVYPGIYRENVVVYKALTISGHDRDTSVFMPGSQSVIVFFIQVHNVTVANLTVENCYFGIWCRNVTGCSIVGNRVTNCTATGIKLESASGCLVKGNLVIGGLRGIELANSSSNVLMNNKIYNFVTQNASYGYGAIHLEFSNNNTIVQNNVKNNTCGVFIYSSPYNEIYHNNFINNTHQVYSDGSLNIWDHDSSSGGNYWSDYVGVDADGNGLGDTPYIIDNKNKDRYPLMEPLAIN
jgi:nitrous oxidase accessory protein